MRAGIGCRKVRQLKWRFLDRTLDNATYAQVEAHLRVCIPCRHDYTLSAQALEALKKGVELSPELRKALERPRFPALKLALGMVLIALVLAGGGWSVWQSGWLERWLAQRPTAVAPPPQPNTEASPITRLKVPVATGEQPGLMAGMGGAPEQTEALDLPTEKPTATSEPPPDKPTPPSVEPANNTSAQVPPPTPQQVAPQPKPTQAPERPARPARPAQRPKASTASQSAPAQRAPLPEGTIEVYDESGQLIKREKLPSGEKR